MSVLRNLDMNGYAEFRHAIAKRRDEIGALSPYAGHIANAFLTALREKQFNAGKIQKIIIQLRTALPTKPNGDSVKFQDMIDVYAINIIFDFEEYILKSPLEKAQILQKTLFDGLCEISKELQLPVESVEWAMKSVEAEGFLFEYKDRKPVVRKSFGRYAQVVLAQSPMANPQTMIAAEVFEINSDKKIGSCVFYESVRLHKYTGTLKWISSSRLSYIPKDESLPPEEREILETTDPFEKMRTSMSFVV